MPSAGGEKTAAILRGVDLSLADSDGPERPYAAPGEIGGDEIAARSAGKLARREGFAPETSRHGAKSTNDSPCGRERRNPSPRAGIAPPRATASNRASRYRSCVARAFPVQPPTPARRAASAKRTRRMQTGTPGGIRIPWSLRSHPPPFGVAPSVSKTGWRVRTNRELLCAERHRGALRRRHTGGQDTTVTERRSVARPPGRSARALRPFRGAGAGAGGRLTISQSHRPPGYTLETPREARR